MGYGTVVEWLGNEASAELNRINRALAKIGSGCFGFCSSYGNQIQNARLEAMRYGDVCISCSGKRSSSCWVVPLEGGGVNHLTPSMRMDIKQLGVRLDCDRAQD
ncbi:MAG: hypothetical protein QS748_07045 [Candidatus Endonucleobacter bathymodioli]|uniref:Uncharacterized protein n=1 Tax=Candidatus Endonucleibacter bathymodioli TaxID=539814 RepID=A0AA90SMK7_9GAMM|nr:hypothetical protein [Candidatus Endonucleobacter bathymodioli]